MRDIAIGDRVRVLSGTEEGTVLSIKRDIVEVEIEDGFTIPVLNKDLVVVSSVEREHFGEEYLNDDEPAADAFITKATGEVYIGLVKNESSNGYQLSLVNHTEHAILFYIYQKKENQFILIKSGQLESLSYDTLKPNLSDSEVLSVAYIKVGDKLNSLPKLNESTFRIKAQWFIKELATIPLVRARGYFFPINETIEEINVDQLKSAMFGEDQIRPKTKYTPVSSILDLHLEELTDSPESIAPSEILPFQLEVFEAQLDKAISSGNDDLTVVHGVGNGTLKHNIQKRLSGHPHVAYFKDAQKEKFGYGALYIKFK